MVMKYDIYTYKDILLKIKRKGKARNRFRTLHASSSPTSPHKYNSKTLVPSLYLQLPFTFTYRIASESVEKVWCPSVILD